MMSAFGVRWLDTAFFFFLSSLSTVRKEKKESGVKPPHSKAINSLALTLLGELTKGCKGTAFFWRIDMRSALTLLSLAIVAHPLLAQAPPRISLVQPAGGKAGTTVKFVVTGQDLDGAEGLHFSFAGAKVETLGAGKVAEEMTKKGDKKKGAADLKAVTFQVVLPGDAPLGIHDVRVVTKNGVSNPKSFVVGDIAEIVEKEPNDDVPIANKVPLNSTVSGLIDKAIDVDYFQFTGKKGQRVVASCLTTSIESRLQAGIEIYTSTGKLLAANRNYQNYDAVTDAVLPADGDYFVRLFSFTHTQGGNDYNYRLTIGTMPWIDAVTPAAVEPGKETKVEVLGRNLPGGVIVPNLTLDGRPLERAIMPVTAPAGAKAEQQLASAGPVLPAMSALDGFDLRLSSPSGSSNPYFLALAKSKVAVEAEPNDSSEKGTAAALPVQVSGRIDHKGDVDWFRFAAKKDVPLGIELFADRLHPAMLTAAVDLKFVVLGPKGNVITTQDENPETMAPQFFARNEDPLRFRLVPTEDGEYKVGISSADGSFGPRHVYSLRIAPEDGDFRIVAMPMSAIAPDSASMGVEGQYAFTLFIWRLGNFTSDIALQGGKLPPGVSVKPQVISGTQKQAAVVVSVAADAPPYVGPIEIEAAATVNGQKLVRDVRAATIIYPTQQAGPPLLARLDREMVLAIRGKAPYALVPSQEKIVVPQGGKVNLSLKLNRLSPDFKAAVTVSAVSLPTGMILQPTAMTADKDVALSFDSKTTVQPGNYTLILRGQTIAPNAKQPPKAGGPPNIIEHAPPIQLTIIPKALLKVTPPANAVKLERGKDAEVVVQLARLLPYDGPIEFDFVGGPKGVLVAPLKLKGDATEAKLTFRASEDAPAGAGSVTLRVLTLFNDVIVPHETKVAIAVSK
jgi:hypothetical protein